MVIINGNNPSIRILVFGYLDIDVIQLSNGRIHGQLDISIFCVSGYLDTWILGYRGYHGYLDTWIFQLFQFPDNGQPKKLGYPSIRISNYPDITSLALGETPKNGNLLFSQRSPLQNFSRCTIWYKSKLALSDLNTEEKEIQCITYRILPIKTIWDP